MHHRFMHHRVEVEKEVLVNFAWVTRPERPKGAKDEVKRPEGPQVRSRGPEGPSTSSIYIFVHINYTVVAPWVGERWSRKAPGRQH